MLRLRALIFCLLFTITSVVAQTRTGDAIELPSLGTTSAGLLTADEEYQLGQMILRAYRGGLPTSKDPFIETYLEQLIQRIVTYSELANKRIELLVLESPTLNAFAAPGGIIGVNTGTFLVAENEQQLASIIAHEIAHLSQRHYARQVQQRATTATIGVAAILASLVIAASGNSDVALAAIPSVQMASIQSGLRFSRDMEREADRIGIQTLVSGGFNPYAMSDMFELMARSSRFRSQVPEFLMSHPVTESRIADAFSKAQKYPLKQYALDQDFQLIRARVMVANAGNPTVAVKRFSEEAASHHTVSELTAHYGLVLALIQAEQTEAARKALTKFGNLVPADNVALSVAEADILMLEKSYDKAIAKIVSALQITPNNHALNVRLAEIYMATGRYLECETLLREHVKRKPDNDYVWYLLAEVHGLAGHILDVHKARAEYFILNGVFDKAEIQLRNALRLIDQADFHGKARIEQRLMDVKKLQQQKI